MSVLQRSHIIFIDGSLAKNDLSNITLADDGCGSKTGGFGGAKHAAPANAIIRSDASGSRLISVMIFEPTPKFKNEYLQVNNKGLFN